ncbi:MAG: electron transfer flavoprotein subunit beta/FixA family protein [Legionella sp.]
MKIIVAVKPVIDPYVKIRMKADRSGLETKNVKMVMNPFDEIAVEEAIRLKEKALVQDIVLVSIGDTPCQDILRHGLALGADRGILVSTTHMLPSIAIAKVLQAVVKKEQASFVLMGKQSVDGDNNQTPQMLAALLDWPQATNASEIVLTEHHVVVVREIDNGLQKLKLCLPAVVSTDLRLNEPRYVTLPNLMKAKQKPLDRIDLDSLRIEFEHYTKVLAMNLPAPKCRGIKVSSIDELLDKLRHNTNVLD